MKESDFMKANPVGLAAMLGALAVMSACSSPAEPPAKGALSLSITAFSPMPQGSACQVAGSLTLPEAPLTPPSETVIGDSLVDGDQGAEVSCTVKPDGDGFSVNGSIRLGSSALNTSFTLDANGAGTGSMTIVRQAYATQSNDAAMPCTFNKIVAQGGAAWVSFSCPVIYDRSSKASTYCTVDGVLTLQNCKK
jgi:hypothetical protein